MITPTPTSTLIPARCAFAIFTFLSALFFSVTPSTLAAEPNVIDYQENELKVRTLDDVTIQGRLYDAGNDRVIIYCHRLLGSRSGTEVDRLLETFIDRYDLLTFNFRGHQSSGRTSTTGGDEVLDLHAVISLALTEGYGKIVVLGTGMGGTAALRTAALFGNIDALVIVSPSGFSPEVAPFLVRIGTDISLGTDFGRVPLRIFTSTRLGKRYTAGYPRNIISSISDTPLLLVHSENDRLVDLDKLVDAFRLFPEPKKLLTYPGGLRSEDLLRGKPPDDIRDWLEEALPGRGRRDGAPTPEKPAQPPEEDQIAFIGDIPMPPEYILQDYYDRTAGRDGMETGSRGLARRLEEVLAFSGYTISSVAVVDSTGPVRVRISVPKISSVSISGNEQVTEPYIRKILRLGGDYYNLYELDKAIRRLSAEPAVQTAASSVSMRSDGDIDLHLSVIEQKPYRLLLSTKFTDIDEFYGVGFTWNEFNPSGLQVDGRAMVGIFDRDLLTGLGAGKTLWGDNLRLDAKLFDTIKSRDDLDFIYTRQEVHETGGEVSVGYQVTSTASAVLGFFGKEYDSPMVTSDFPVTEGGAAGNFLKLDLGGKLPLQGAPRFNWRHTFYYQNIGLGGGDFDFSAWQLNFTGRLKLWRENLSETTFHYGRLSREAPPQEWFSLGGMTTLPGYPDDSFVGGRMMRFHQAIYLDAAGWVDESSSMEPFRLIINFNAGKLWNETYRPAFANLIMDLGLEFDYEETVRFGIAVSIGPKRLKSPRIYIGWGVHVF